MSNVISLLDKLKKPIKQSFTTPLSMYQAALSENEPLSPEYNEALTELFEYVNLLEQEVLKCVN